jgi:hypothetical protein
MNDDTLIVPNPLKGFDYLRYDMRLCLAAERRLEEIATVNPERGQELLALFNRAAFQLSRVYTDLHLQLELARGRVSERKAIMLVDYIPAKIKEKGLQDNTMSRQALLDLDEEFKLATSIHNNIEAYILYVEKQLKAMEGALSSVKKIYDATNSAYRRPNPNLVTTGIEEKLEESPYVNSKYGKPKY